MNFFSLSNLLLVLLTTTFTASVSVSRILLETEVPAKSNLSVTMLIPYNSVDSPTYNPQATLEEISLVAYETSQARAVYLRESSSYRPTDLETSIVPAPRDGGFYAIIKVGSNRITQKVHVDTGSSLTWINCEPCGLNVPEEIFNPAKSNSYEAEPCVNSSYCNTPLGAVMTYCDARGNGKCTYEIRYGDDHTSMGHLARDDIKFSRSEEVLHKIVFGCSRTTTLPTNGVLGLGNNRISLRAQSGYSKFSYCLGDLSNHNYQYNILIIGSSRIELTGDQTPLIAQNQYFINLEQIKIGGKLLDVDMQVFKRNPDDYTGGMVVDTGSTYSFLPLNVLEEFEWQIRLVFEMAVMDDYAEVGDEKMRVCYLGNMNRDLNSQIFPVVEFIFQGNVAMKLTVPNLFRQVDPDKFCLGFLPSEQAKLPFSLLGNLQQQYHYVAFDLQAMKLAFQRMECSTIEEKIRHDEL